MPVSGGIPTGPKAMRGLSIKGIASREPEPESSPVASSRGVDPDRKRLVRPAAPGRDERSSRDGDRDGHLSTRRSRSPSEEIGGHPERGTRRRSSIADEEPDRRRNTEGSATRSDRPDSGRRDQSLKDQRYSERDDERHRRYSRRSRSRSRSRSRDREGRRRSGPDDRKSREVEKRDDTHRRGNGKDEGRKRRDSGRRRSRSRSSASSDSEDSEEERRRRRKKRKEKERRREEEDREERKRSKKDKEGREGGRDKARRKSNAASSGSWGKYGVITETDRVRMTYEFRAWLVEQRRLDPDLIPQDKVKKEFAVFVEEFNTATLPHEKYYDMAQHQVKMSAMRNGESLVERPKYDPRADEKAHIARLRATHLPDQADLTREEIVELRRLEKERLEVSKRRQLGLEIPKNLGVRMVEVPIETWKDPNLFHSS